MPPGGSANGVEGKDYFLDEDRMLDHYASGTTTAFIPLLLHKRFVLPVLQRILQVEMYKKKNRNNWFRLSAIVSTPLQMKCRMKTSTKPTTTRNQPAV
ncbi:hypothetical protein PHMEG_00033467 [Phytophthora megakarya]|uniref:Uncharacterized protein n=1 Tax=Phytophthora megakarya TaxID=4795 RepID=A0A225UTY9_9STRA|nr:hypothetical protein PHMEG_00033467 [Phytophthora megakarya]